MLGTCVLCDAVIDNGFTVSWVYDSLHFESSKLAILICLGKDFKLSIVPFV